VNRLDDEEGRDPDEKLGTRRRNVDKKRKKKCEWNRYVITRKRALREKTVRVSRKKTKGAKAEKANRCTA